MKLSPNDESQSKFAWPHFREASPQVKLSCPETSSDPYEGSNKSVPTDLLHLSKLVGNPTTEENVWINACVGAGTRSLAPRHSVLHKTSAFLKSGLGMTLSLLTLFLNFTLAISLTGQGAFFLKGVDITAFFRAFPGVDGLGLVVALLAGLCFWVSLLCKSKTAINIVTSFSAVGVSLLVLLAAYLGPVWDILIACSCLLAVLGLAKVGEICRDALPVNFNAAKVAQSAVGMLLVPASFMAWILYTVLTGSHDSPTYDGSLSAASMYLGMMIFCVIGQGFAMARASKSSSRSACALLAVSVQAPLVVGLCVSACVAGAATLGASFDPNFTIHQQLLYENASNVWKTIGADKTLFLAAASLITVSLAAAGGYLGALANSVKRLKAT
jgi:hypothetical protein